MSLTSPVLLRMFLSSIFVHVDINVKDGALFCDTLCDKGPLIKGQVMEILFMKGLHGEKYFEIKNSIYFYSDG